MDCFTHGTCVFLFSLVVRILFVVLSCCILVRYHETLSFLYLGRGFLKRLIPILNCSYIMCKPTWSFQFPKVFLLNIVSVALTSVLKQFEFSYFHRSVLLLTSCFLTEVRSQSTHVSHEILNSLNVAIFSPHC